MTSADPAVSVVLPTYNRADRLPRSIRCVLNQTYTDFELIVVDDASTDDTEAVVAGFDDPRIEYVEHGRNRGASAARNTGIDRARGGVVAFQDSDDEWLSEKLRRQMEVFRDAPADVGVVYTGMWRTVDGERRYLRYPGVERKRGDVRDALLRYNFVSTQMAAVRRECFEEVGRFDESLPALVDWELWLRVSRRFRFEFVDEPLVEAAVQSDSISTNVEDLVEARARIVNKHRESFDRRSLANHLFHVGNGSMKTGDTTRGRRYLRRAARTDPRPRHLSAWLVSLFGNRAYTTAYDAVKLLRS